MMDNQPKIHVSQLNFIKFYNYTHDLNLCINAIAIIILYAMFQNHDVYCILGSCVFLICRRDDDKNVSENSK